MNNEQNENLKKKVAVIGSTAATSLAKNLHELAKNAGVAQVVTNEMRKAVNLAAGLSEKGKTRNPNYLSGSTGKKMYRVICAPAFLADGAKKITPAIKHPNSLYGTLNKPIYVHGKRRGESGVFPEKVKIALAKGLIKSA